MCYNNGMNTKTVVVRARIDPRLKSEAQTVLDGLDLSMTDAIRMYLNQIRLRRGIPFDVCLHNEETLAAMRELESGKGATAKTVDDMFAKLRK